MAAGFPIGISLMDGGGTLPGGYAMADVIGKIEGLAGLALLGGLAFAALKFGPGIVAAFRDAMAGLSGAHQVVSPRAGVEAHGDAVWDALDAERRAWEAGDALEAERQNAIAWQEAYKSAVDAGSATLGWNPILQATTRFAGDLAVDTALGRGATSTGTSAVRFVSGSAVSAREAKKAQKEAMRSEYQKHLAAVEASAAKKAQKEAERVAKKEQKEAERAAKVAQMRLEREAQRIRNEQQYNAWLQSTKPASKSVADFLNAGKQYQGQQEVAPGVWVAPSGAYQVIRDGQIVAGGSAGAVQGASVKANTAMYPGTNYRREVVEAYQAKARAGDAAAAAWLKRFAPAGAV